MVIIKLIGGLGNQLFQYAAAKSLAHFHNTNLKLDATAYAEDHLRNFNLAAFQMPLSFANKDEIETLIASGSIERIINRCKPYSKKRFYKEPFFHYDTNFFKLGKDVYLQGYFQSQKYFEKIASVIKSELTLKEDITSRNLEVSDYLKQPASVSIHIRRGDYKNSASADYHGLLPLDYYQQAMELMTQKLQAPKFFIFTDDEKWVAENFPLVNTEIVSGTKSATHFDDFYLMSQCRHNIIANSSFSWWAAWLNNNPDKIVVAPKKWFNNGPKDIDDLLPQKWKSI